MKRFVSIILASALLAAWVGAQAPARRIAPADQVKLLQRNRQLYRAAVNSGLEVTGQFDPLERARSSTTLARQLSDEIQKAAQDQDAARAAEFGHHLVQLVDQGVAPNLKLARDKIPAGSEAERLLFQRRDEVLEVLQPIEELLQKQFSGSDKNLDAVRRELAAGREKLERSAKK